MRDLYIGSLLHDIGKIMYRAGDGRNHSVLGKEFLIKQEFNRRIADCANFHHARKLKGAQISDDSICYIVYYADNISASSDRRELEE
ncbi:MAG: HD domain-containing protein, partial [Clostridiales bacterium]|nr:HD domain-containing protein [Clostridiales bacterium]